MYLREHRRRRRQRALGGVSSRPRYAGQGPSWYRAMQGASLGDDDVITEPTITDAQFTRDWQGQMLAAQNRLAETGAKYVRQEKVQKALQLAATLAIPLSAVAWRWIFQWWQGRKVGPSPLL